MIALAIVLGILLMMLSSTVLTMMIGLSFNLIDAQGYFEWYVFPLSLAISIALFIYFIARRNK